jgi:hypothetical protein
MVIRVHKTRELTLEGLFPYAYQYITAGAYLCIFLMRNNTQDRVQEPTQVSRLLTWPHSGRTVPPPPPRLTTKPNCTAPQKPRSPSLFFAQRCAKNSIKCQSQFHDWWSLGCGPTNHLIIKEAGYTFCSSFLHPCMYTFPFSHLQL